jgi:hypothetical protein
MLVDTEPNEPSSVVITRLLCLTTVVMTVLVGAGFLLFVRSEYANAAVALIGVVIGASFGMVRLDGTRRRKPP